MTEQFLLGLIRSLLHDTGRGMATSARFYDDAVLLRGINIAVQELSLALIMRQPRAEITVRSLLSLDSAVTPGFPGSAVQPDFWLLECGYYIDGEGRLQYVPAISIETGERTQYFSTSKMYVRGGNYYGSATHALYWRLPKKITGSNATLTDFPDAFYHAAKLKAATDLVAQEDHDALDRWQALNADFEKAVTSLK